MANARQTILPIVALILSLLLVANVVDGRSLAVGIIKAPTLTCNAVYGVQSGDTCFSIAQKFSLTVGAFNTINPNLDCDKLFVSQWLCVNGGIV